MFTLPEAGLVALDDAPEAPPRTSRFRLSPDSRCFEGHFDGHPILPGVAHLALALRACAREQGEPRRLTEVQDVRFTHPLGPGDEVEVALQDGRAPGSVRFELRCRGQRASTGLLLFAPDSHA